jgi:23S rRNA (adenine2503-C2)-methyltransferase
MAKHFYSLTREQLTDWMTAHGQPAYRAKQVLEAVYRRALGDFDQMTNLPAALRVDLAEAFDLRPVAPDAVSGNEDTVKLLLSLPGGGQVECVRITMDNAATACVSSQIGCAVGCAFCATGLSVYERSLTVGEILSQVVALNRLGTRARNVVFMGMGEPFNNYANVVNAVRRLTDRDYLGLSPQRITVSTAGVVPGIHHYAADGLPTELAVSLNASTDEQRRALMPGVAKWSLAQLLEACRHFSEVHGGRPVTFAYVLLGGVNDDFDDAERLRKLLRDQPHHLNLIPWNEVGHAEFQPPGYPRVQAFLHACRRHGLNVSLRRSRGGDIEAACGQLRARRQGEAAGVKGKSRSREA